MEPQARFETSQNGFVVNRDRPGGVSTVCSHDATRSELRSEVPRHSQPSPHRRSAPKNSGRISRPRNGPPPKSTACSQNLRGLKRRRLRSMAIAAASETDLEL